MRLIARKLLSKAPISTSNSTPPSSRTFTSSLSKHSTSTSDPTPSTSQAPSPAPDSDLASDIPPDSESASTPSNAAAGKPRKGFRAWLDGEGVKYKNPTPGRTNWIGDTPFPMNPTFAPLPPLADTIKTNIYNAYTFNILEAKATDSQVIRAVSSKFGVGMDRVRAIVRLKELEKKWKDEGKPLETNLLEQMESYLGVKQPLAATWRGMEDPDAPIEHRAKTKTIFEMIDVESGDSPVFLPLLSHLPSDASASPRKASPKLSRKDKVIPATRPGRPAMVFKDVSGTDAGAKFAQTRTKPAKRSGRRSEETAESELGEKHVAR